MHESSLQSLKSEMEMSNQSLILDIDQKQIKIAELIVDVEVKTL